MQTTAYILTWAVAGIPKWLDFPSFKGYQILCIAYLIGSIWVVARLLAAVNIC